MGWDLVGDIRASIADIAVHLAQNANVLVAVQERVLVFAVHARAARASMRGFVRLKAGIGQHDDESLRVFISRRDRCALFGYELG